MLLFISSLFLVLFSWQAQLLSRPSNPRPAWDGWLQRAGFTNWKTCYYEQIWSHESPASCWYFAKWAANMLTLFRSGGGTEPTRMLARSPSACRCKNLKPEADPVRIWIWSVNECQLYLLQHGSTKKRWFDLILDLVKESARHKVFESLETCLVGTADSLQMLLSKACGLGSWKCKPKI